MKNLYFSIVYSYFFLYDAADAAAVPAAVMLLL